MRGQPAHRQPPQPGRLRRADRLGRIAVGDRRPRLDLDEDEHVALGRDDVELAVGAAPVALEDDEPVGRQRIGGQLLAEAPDRILDPHPATVPDRPTFPASAARPLWTNRVSVDGEFDSSAEHQTLVLSSLPVDIMEALVALPDFLVIGAPKAGSTAVHEALVQHPQLFLSNPKEPKYFLTGGPPAEPARSPRPRRCAQRAGMDLAARPLRAALRCCAARHAARREHPVLPLGHRRAPAHPRRCPARQADRDHPRPDRPRVLELDPPARRRPRARTRLPHRLPARTHSGPTAASRRSGATSNSAATASSSSTCSASSRASRCTCCATRN